MRLRRRPARAPHRYVVPAGAHDYRYWLGVSTESARYAENDFTADAGWTPTLHTKIDSAEAADRAVARGAGAGRIQ
jgi:hypothetical protein